MANLIKDIDYATFIGQQEAQELRPASDFIDELTARLNGEYGEAGLCLPWSKTHELVRLRPGEVSIWAGINGHGKSMVLGQVAAWLMLDTRIVIASMEMKPEATLARMVRQVSGYKNPTDEFVDFFIARSNDRLWIYDQLDTVESDRIIGMIWYAANELDVQHVIIDSLMKCGIKTDDYNAQKTFVDRLCWTAKTLNVHIHLVHHMRKGEREGTPPDKFDIRGASEITDLADNVFIVHRNKDKEAKLERGEDVADNLPDASLTISKQRHGEWEGRVALWFDRRSQSFSGAPRANDTHPLVPEFMRRGIDTAVLG